MTIILLVIGTAAIIKVLDSLTVTLFDQASPNSPHLRLQHPKLTSFSGTLECSESPRRQFPKIGSVFI
jgi:hypothetical protein